MAKSRIRSKQPTKVRRDRNGIRILDRPEHARAHEPSRSKWAVAKSAVEAVIERASSAVRATTAKATQWIEAHVRGAQRAS